MRYKVGDQVAFGGRRRDLRKQPQYVIAQSCWRGRPRRSGEQSDQRFRWHRTLLASPAGITAPNVAAHALAHQHGRPPVPADQHPFKVRTVLAPPACHHQCPEGTPQPGAGARDRGIGTSGRQPKDVIQVRADEMVPQAQFDNVTIIQAEPAHSRDSDLRLAEFRCRRRLAVLPPRRPATLPPISRLLCISRATRSRGGQTGRIRACTAIRPAAAFVAGQRVQPRPQPVRIAQLTQPAHRDHERHSEGANGSLLVQQHAMAVRIQRRGIPIVKFGVPSWLPGQDSPSNRQICRALLHRS